MTHRDSQCRYVIRDGVYFISCKTGGNYPFFRERIFCDLFVDNLMICKQLKGFLLYAWILVYDHFHLLIRQSDGFNMSDVMFSIKKQFSHDVNRVMGFNPLYSDNSIPKARKRLRAFLGGPISVYIQIF